ncbi:hypothetical protein Agub_g2985, partial [Astrephomene gubernaculifera]
MAELQFARSLLYDTPPDVLEEEQVLASEDTRALRIASVFIILATGLLGGLPPLFLKVFRDQDSTTTRLVRSFSAGVIAALALVHIIPEAISDMSSLGSEYPLGGVCVLGGVVLMVGLEHLAHIMHSHPAGGVDKRDHHHSATANGDGTTALGGAAAGPGAATVAVGPCSGGGCGAVTPVMEGVPVQAEASKHAHSFPLSPSQPPLPCAPVAAGEGHSHVCVSRGSASNWVAAAAVETLGGLRQRVVAYLFELGCIFHSFIIGLSLGVNRTDLTEVRSLLLALAFHQWLEGISLASVVVRGGFSMWKGAAMIATYSLTCPLGIAVGMAIAQSYDGESRRALGVQGALNGVSGGLLLYISLVQLVAEDMGRMAPGSGQGG